MFPANPTPSLDSGALVPTEIRTFSGELVWPNDPAYETARHVYNQRIDMRPSLLARPRTNADVITALRWAREHDLEIAVRSSGHNYNGFGASDGGVVIDLGLMRSVRVDPLSATGRIGGGTPGGDLVREGALFELAPSMGMLGVTGVGLMLGGGFGHLRNRAGWAADNIVGADLVTADGRLVRVSTEEHPDLLWGLRGAGANFGVVTSLDVQLHSMPSAIATGCMIWGEDRLRESLRAIRELSARASDDLSILGWLKLAPDPDEGGPAGDLSMPTELRGRPCLEFYYLHWGAPDQAEADIEELRAACRPDVECRTTTSFAEFHHYWGPGWGRSVPRRIVWDAASVSELNEDAIDVLIDISGTLAEPGTLRMIELFDQRGALSREPAIPSAQPRALPTAWSLRPGATSEDPAMDEANDEWLHGFMRSVLASNPGIPDACALNSTSYIPTEERIRTHYGDALGRLIDLKREWDPDNVFCRTPQNIDPAWR